jgi:hypothetical protein
LFVLLVVFVVLFGDQQKNMSGVEEQLKGSKDNIAVRGSKGDIVGGLSKAGSLRNVGKTGVVPAGAASETESQPAANNAQVYENTYKLKPDKK